MSGLDKNRKRNHTISFRVSPMEQKNIEARIEASGMSKMKYYLQSCLYGRIVVVGSRQNIDRLIESLQEMEVVLKVILDEMSMQNYDEVSEKILEIREDYCSMVKAIAEVAHEANILVQK